MEGPFSIFFYLFIYLFIYLFFISLFIYLFIHLITVKKNSSYSAKNTLLTSTKIQRRIQD